MVDRDLSTNYLGLAIPSPIVVASCGLTNSVENIRILADAGAGAVVLKSIFEEQIRADVAEVAAEARREAPVHPEIAQFLSGYSAADAVEKTLALIREAKRAVRIPIIASVHCVSPHAWTDFARRVEEAGADALELNVFIFPANARHGSGWYEHIYYDVVNEVRRRVSLPLALKIGWYFSSPARMIKRLSRSGAAGLVLFNRFHRPDYDIERLTIGAAPYFSEPHEIHLPLRWIGIASPSAECDLAAATGIHDGAGVVKTLLAGAAVAQVATTLYKNGMDYIATMLRDVDQWMDRHDFETIESFRGKLSRANAQDHAAYERVQYMKRSIGVE